MQKQVEEREKLQFRKPAPDFIKFEKKGTPKEEPSTKPVVVQEEEHQDDQAPKDEPRKMFFYYPKYLHPEAVALIAQNLLNEWEGKETQQLPIHTDQKEEKQPTPKRPQKQRPQSQRKPKQ